MSVDSVELASGRLVVLHEPGGHEAWAGEFRLVTYVRAALEPEMVADPLLPSVGWTWLLEALDAHGAAYDSPSGTVTRVISESFGSMADEPAAAEIEVRASWTALEPDLAAHTEGWGELLCHIAGLPPLPEGVAALPAAVGRAAPAAAPAARGTGDGDGYEQLDPRLRPEDLRRSGDPTAPDGLRSATRPEPAQPTDGEPLLEPREGLPPVVEDPEALLAAVERLGAGTGPLAVDAERASGYRYGQRAYLVQLRRAGGGTVLVDPIACPDLARSPR